MIARILIGGRTDAEEPEAEAGLARHLLDRALRPYPAPRFAFPAQGIAALAQAAKASGALQGLDDAARVLLIAHDQLLPAPGCIEALLAAVTEATPCVAACDASCCGPADYQTVRGLERFVSRRAQQALYVAEAGPPLLMLATLAALRQECHPAPIRLSHAWVHDFSGYHAQRREEMLPLVPEDCGALLDVGGGRGGFLAAVKARFPACQTALVERSATALRHVAAAVDRVWHGDFLEVDIDARFDCISFLDVLEHCPEPAAMLLKARQLLTPRGSILASIPNVGHWTVVSDLIEGRWDYAPAGIHCITHLRFFTRRSIETLFDAAGLRIIEWQPMTVPPPPWFVLDALRGPLAVDDASLATVGWRLRAIPE